MTLKGTFTTYTWIILILLLLLVMMTFSMLRNQERLAESEEVNFHSYNIAIELKLSSEDLTQYCRNYVATGDSIWEYKYHEVLDIRNGLKPRPDGRQISLQDSLRKLGVTQEEFEILALAEKESNALTWTEEVAFHAMKGLFPDSLKQFTIKGDPDHEMATRILYDEKYLQNKSRIMGPIEHFIDRIHKRTNEQLTDLNKKAMLLLEVIIALILLIGTVTIISYFSVRYRIILKMEELAKANIEISRSRAEADAANRAKSDFLSSMSHELRTPLNSILGFAQLLDMGPLSDRDRTNVHHILRGGRHLLDLINEILDISRIESNRISMSIEPVNLQEVISESFDVVKPIAESNGIRLHYEKRADISVFVKVDRQRLKQVLLNIINNAIKYNRPGGDVFIEAEAFDEPDRPRKVRISVRDTGFGIKSEDLPKLFAPFERLGAEQTGKEGTGLGLVVVKKLTELMDGLIGVESEYGTGSTFWVEFYQAHNPVERAKVGPAPLSTENIEEGKPIRVLYIEDNRANIELLTMGFEQLCPQNELFTAMNGTLGINEAKRLVPDLILLDLNMPDMHGSAVLAELRKEETTREIPVIVISADAMPAQRKQMREAGAADFLTKPIDMLELIKVMKEVVKA